ncbi:MAG: hypothetical protein WC563_15590 [Brevundimonas sp.]
MNCRTCAGKGWVEGYGDEAPRIGPNDVYQCIEVPCPSCGPRTCGCGEPATIDEFCADCHADAVRDGKIEADGDYDESREDAA